MRVLAFSAYYTPEIAASLYLTEDIYKGITDAGNTIEVFVPTPTRGISKYKRKEYKKKRIEKKNNGKLIIHRVAMFREGRSTILRAIRYLLINVAFIWKGMKTDADVVFVQSTPPTQGMMAGLLSKWKRIPLIYNLQDVFPDSLVNAGITSKGSFIWKIGRKIEDFSYHQSKKIIVISEDFKNNIMDKGVPENKIVVIPNWADTKGVFPIDRKENKLIQRYGLDPNLFYIVYSGNIGYSQNMDMLLNVAKKIEEEVSSIRFVIIGDGADKERIQKRVNDERIDSIIMLPFQPYQDIAHVFSLGDVGLIISKPGIGNNSVPSKIWSIMSAGRPVLASFDEESDLCRLIDKSGCGIHSDAGNEEALLANIKAMYHGDNTKYGEAGLFYVKAYNNREMRIDKYVAQL